VPRAPRDGTSPAGVEISSFLDRPRVAEADLREDLAWRRSVPADAPLCSEWRPTQQGSRRLGASSAGCPRDARQLVTVERAVGSCPACGKLLHSPEVGLAVEVDGGVTSDKLSA